MLREECMVMPSRQCQMVVTRLSYSHFWRRTPTFTPRVESTATLQVASYGGHKAIMQLLLEKNTNIHIQGGHFGNAFLVESAHSHDGVKGLLQEEGQHQCAGRRAQQHAPYGTKI